jgi:predicted signal transduction protein with EAL and GGDEF domain
VETRSQFQALVDLDVNMIQGYFVAPPLPKEVAESLLERTAGHPNHLAKILADRMQGSGSAAKSAAAS